MIEMKDTKAVLNVMPLMQGLKKVNLAGVIVQGWGLLSKVKLTWLVLLFRGGGY